jgi:hypothetical protein
MIRRVVLAAAALGLIAGCRNPFDPSADIRLERFFANGGLITIVTQATALNSVDSNGAGIQSVRADFSNFSTVGGNFTSYTVVYRQLPAQPAPVNLDPGSPIPSLGGAAGRRFYELVHFQGLRDDTNTNGFNTFSMFPRIITAELLKYIGSGLGSSSIGGGIDCEVIFFGEDHNGHEIKVGGVLHVQVD